MVIREDGKIGISTNSPTEKLEVNGNIKCTHIYTNFATLPNGTRLKVGNTQLMDGDGGYGMIGSLHGINDTNYMQKYALMYTNNATNSNTYLNCVGTGNIYLTNNNSTKTTITNQGHIGINETDASEVIYPLFVNKTVIVSSGDMPHTMNATYKYTRYVTGNHHYNYSQTIAAGEAYSACFNGFILVENGMYVSSDSRIKTNIIDVPDKLNFYLNYVLYLVDTMNILINFQKETLKILDL